MEEQISAIIANNLIELRKSRNLKQTDLSETLGYSDKTISRWENGTSVPDVETLIKISQFYGIGIEDLVKKDAVKKSSEEAEIKGREKFTRDITMLSLAICTLWLVLVLFYVGFILFKKEYIWQFFIWGVPITAFLVYRTTKRYYTKLWLAITLFVFVSATFIVAVYLTILQYNFNFWPIFLILIPLEGMGIVNITYRHKMRSRKSPEKIKEQEQMKENLKEQILKQIDDPE